MADTDSASELSAPPTDVENELTSAANLQGEQYKRSNHTGKRKPQSDTRKRGIGHLVEISPKKRKISASQHAGGGATRKTGAAQAVDSPAPISIKGSSAQTKKEIERALATTVKSRQLLKGGEAVKVKEEAQGGQTQEPGDATVKQAKRKRKTKEEKQAEMLPLAPRTIGSKLFIGAHVSGAGGVHNAVLNSVHIGGNAFALFLKSQRKWANPPLIDDHCTTFVHNCNERNYDASKHVVPHGSYLVNLCHPDPVRTVQAYEAFLDDLVRCNKLGITLYNFHPGNSAGADSREHAIQHLASNLNKSHADPSTGSVVTLLETMATRGNTIGGTFEDLRNTIDLVSKKDRVGVCLDTCHVFAAGYDISTAAGLSAVLDDFDATVGLKYLRALHVNDSKAPLSSHRDLHANIGTGFLGLRAFHALVNEPRLWGLPMVLETPIDAAGEDGKEVQDKSIWAREIKLLESMVGMDAESDEFVALEQTLKAQGQKERERIGDQVKRRDEKTKSPKKKGKKKKEDTESTSDV